MVASAILLSVLGLWISFYFTGVSCRWFSPNVKWIPRFCQFTEASCQLVLETPRAKLFGVPNSVYGMGLYLYLIVIFLVVGSRPASPLLWTIGLIAAGLAALRSIYLAYSLLFITRVPCPLCFTTHIINLILFISLGFGR